MAWDWSGPNGIWTAVGGALGTVGSVMFLRRKNSRDNAEMARDRSEENHLTALRLERDEAMRDAREAWTTRTADAQKIAHLTAENEALRRDIARMLIEFDRLERHLQKLQRAVVRLVPDAAAVLGSEFGQLDQGAKQ
jgi:hypothetical protein